MNADYSEFANRFIDAMESESLAVVDILDRGVGPDCQNAARPLHL